MQKGNREDHRSRVSTLGNPSRLVHTTHRGPISLNRTSNEIITKPQESNLNLVIARREYSSFLQR